MSHTPKGMGSWTPAPWKAVDAEIAATRTEDLDAGVVATMSINYSQAMREANAARIVACVNGCAGLNPAAYRECVEALQALVDSRDGQGAMLVYKVHISVFERAKHALALAESQP